MQKLELIKELRIKTNLSISECKKALDITNYDIVEAYTLLQSHSALLASKKSNRVTKTGTFGIYTHNNSTILGIVELLSETDFVAKNEKFKELARDLAAQVVFSSQLRAISEEELLQDKTISYSTNEIESFVLLKQPFFKDDSITIKELLDKNSAIFGEKLEIANFYYYTI